MKGEDLQPGKEGNFRAHNPGLGYRRRHLFFLLYVLVSLLVFWRPLRALIDFTLTHDYGSHIILIVPVSAYIFYRRHREIFQDMQFNFGVGLSLFLVGSGLLWIHQRYSTEFLSEHLFVVILSIVLLWIAGFVLIYGTRAFARARFPLLFLLLMVPIPDPWIARLIFLLQAGSATVAYGLLRLLNVPVFRQGFTLVLPTLDIEVARECSGIRSSLALFITTLMLGKFLLRSTSRKFLLVVAILPILIVKNGIRIVTVSLLSVYVSRDFLYGWIHTSGGIVFYSLGLLILVPIIRTLRKSEDPKIRDGQSRTAALNSNTLPARTR